MPKAKRVPAKSVDGRGQPTIRTPETAATICAVISSGKTMQEAADTAGIALSTLKDWSREDSQFASLLASARVEWADATVDKCNILAAQPPKMISGDDGTERVDAGWVQHINSQLNWAKWVISKRDPKRYGDRLEVDQKVTGEIEHTHTFTDEQRQSLMAKKRLAMEQRGKKFQPSKS